MKEIFKDIPGYEGKYQVSNFGNVKTLNYRNTKKEKVMNKTKYNNGYYVIKFGDKKRYLIHRLVLLAFIGPSKLDCNHKNGVKTDNRLENLEYVTKSENILHSYRVLGQKAPWKGKKGGKHNCSRIINQYDKKLNFIRQWTSMIEAQKELGIFTSSISNVCRGINKTAGGYIWKYV